MNEFEFEQLKQRVSELEKEVDSLKQIVKADNYEAKTYKPVEAEAESETIAALVPNQVSLMAVCKKIVGIDSDGIKHQNGFVRYIIDGRGFVALTEEDLDDETWNCFESNPRIQITYCEDILHPSVNINGRELKMFGHLDTNTNDWKKVRNEETGRMDFVRATKSGVNIPADAPVAKEKESFEKKLGAKWMGIFASVLIFVGFVLFGASIYAVLSDAFKTAILLIISAAFTFTGVYKLEHDTRAPILWNIVAGCGIGGSYITFLLMNMVFHQINDLVLVVLLIAWIAATIIMAKRFSRVFFYVCYLGIIISTVLCEFNWSSTLISFAFYLVTTIVLIAASYETEYRRNYFWSVQFPIVFIYFSSVYKDYELKSALLWAALLIILLVQPHIFSFVKEVDYLVYMFACLMPSLLCCIHFASILRDNGHDSIMAFVVALSLIALLINTSLKFKDKSLYKNILFYLCVLVLPFLPYHSIYENYLGMALFFIPAFVYGFISEKNKYLGIGSAYLVLYFFLHEGMKVDMKIVSALTLITVIGLIIMCVLKSISWIRLYLFGFISLAIIFLGSSENWYNGGLSFLLIAGVCLLANTKWFIEDNRAVEIIVKVFTLVTMLTGYAFTAFYKSDLIINEEIVYGSEKWYTLLICLMTLGLCVLCHRYKYWYSLTNEKISASLATATGYLLMILSILKRLEAASYIVSIILIVLSIIFIALGFKFDNKSVRLYGLILSLICTIKIVFFDIQYDSSIYYPIGLFICGGMCLFICWLYNMIEKKTGTEE